MLLLDDILLSPAKGVMWLFREIHNQAEAEQSGEVDRLRDALTDLYRMLETGVVAEEEFERREARLLSRLEALESDEDEEQDDEDAGDCLANEPMDDMSGPRLDALADDASEPEAEVSADGTLSDGG